MSLIARVMSVGYWKMIARLKTKDNAIKAVVFEQRRRGLCIMRRTWEQPARGDRISLISFWFFLILCVSFTPISVWPQSTSEKQLESMDVPTFDLQDELAGAVRSLVVERVELQRADSKRVETQPRLVLKTNYDDKGRQLEELSYDPQGVLFKKTLRTYDPTGELQEIRAYAPDGSLMCRQVYSYDSANRTIKELADNGRKTTETVYSLDERGKVISQTTVDSDEQLSIRLVMQYDVREKLTEIATCVSDSQQLAIVPGDSARKSVMLSDEMRQRLKGKGPCSDGLLTSKIVFSRDHSGHLVEATIYSGDGVLVEKNGYSREYDSDGNWIKETQSRWNSESDRFEPAALTYRKIVYR